MKAIGWRGGGGVSYMELADGRRGVYEVYKLEVFVTDLDKGLAAIRQFLINRNAPAERTTITQTKPTPAEHKLRP